MDDRGIPLIVAPAAYPVLLSEVKEWCRIDSQDTSQDITLNLLIAMATKTAEHLTGRCFVQRTLQLPLQWFERTIVFPLPPLIGVDKVEYTDIDGNVQTVDPSVYEIDTMNDPGKIQPKWKQFWPVLLGIGYTFNPVRITYRAGYVPPGSPQDLTDNSYLPPELRIWMQSRMASFYNNREQYVIDTRLIDVQVPRDFADGVLDGLMIGTRYF
jgi:uncharacterized phiE125 gp8 family phage protein